MKRTFTGAALLLFLFLLSVTAGARKPRLDKEPSWVSHMLVSSSAASLDGLAEDGYVHLLFEKQVNLEAGATYFRTVKKILSETGAQNNSEVSVSYDPAYEEVIFHSVRIIRGGRPQDRLKPDKIRTIQEEKDRAQFLYDGTLSAILLLEDLRKGDLVEYSYTIKGRNPVFGGRYTTLLDTRFAVPVYGLYYKLIVPQQRRLTIRNSLTSVEPQVQQAGNNRIYEWKLSDLEPLHTEDNTPSWYDPYPMIMVSEYGSWKEVADWARDLYVVEDAKKPGLFEKIREISSRHPLPEDRLRAALRYVQDEVRYLGIESGISSHKPHHPEQVLQQGYGDCKDKSLLLCTLLKGLGIEAHPVLINTEYRQTIAQWLPSPTSFDHVTVRVSLNGRHYFFDPTISLQRGKPEDIFFPGYGVGLVITDTTTALTPIPVQGSGEVSVREVFDVKSMNGRARLVVTTAYSGSFADGIRSDFNESSTSSLLANYKEYYSEYFQELTADSLTTSDDEETGVFTTVEYYTIRNFWGSSNTFKKAYFEPFVIDGILSRPKNKDRTAPFAITYPAKYREEIEVNLPEPWSFDRTSHHISNSAFRMSIRQSGVSTRTTLKYEYETLKDAVLPEEMEEYQSGLEEASEHFGYELTQSFTSTDTGPLFSAGNSTYNYLYLLLGLCVFITYLVRRK